LIIVKKLANSKKNEIKKLENELKYLEELHVSNTRVAHIKKIHTRVAHIKKIHH
jgi:cell shape-determining protein MreC